MSGTEVDDVHRLTPWWAWYQPSKRFLFFSARRASSPPIARSAAIINHRILALANVSGAPSVMGTGTINFREERFHALTVAKRR